MASTHADGTPCKEGTRSAPDGYAPCCDLFDGHTSACDFDVRYEWWAGPARRVITIAESAGGGGIWIRFCPHCGSKLSASG